MSSAQIDLIGTVGDPTTQGLGRLISQYVKSPKMIALLQGIYSMGQDLENLYQRLGRILNVDDWICYTPDGGQTYPENTAGATDDQLRIIAQLVGVSKYLDDGDIELTDAELRQLIKAKIHRDHAQANIPGLRMALWWIFDPENAQALTDGETATTTITMVTEDLGTMGVRVCLIYSQASAQRAPTATQLAMMQLKVGRSNLPHALLPMASGTNIALQWQTSDPIVPQLGVFSFSTYANPGVPLSPDGLGFNTDTYGTYGTWAIAFE